MRTKIYLLAVWVLLQAVGITAWAQSWYYVDNHDGTVSWAASDTVKVYLRFHVSGTSTASISGATLKAPGGDTTNFMLTGITDGKTYLQYTGNGGAPGAVLTVGLSGAVGWSAGGKGGNITCSPLTVHFSNALFVPGNYGATINLFQDVYLGAQVNTKNFNGSLNYGPSAAGIHKVKILSNGVVIQEMTVTVPEGGCVTSWAVTVPGDAGRSIVVMDNGNLYASYSSDAYEMGGYAGSVNSNVPGTQSTPVPTPSPTPSGTPSPSPSPGSGSGTIGGRVSAGGSKAARGVAGAAGASLATGLTRGDVYDAVKAAALDAAGESNGVVVDGEFDMGETLEAGDADAGIDKIKGDVEQNLSMARGAIDGVKAQFSAEKACPLPSVSGRKLAYEFACGKYGVIQVNLTPYEPVITMFRKFCLLGIYITYWFVSVRWVRSAVA